MSLQTLERPGAGPAPLPPEPPVARRALPRSLGATRWASLVLAGPLLVLVGIVHGVGLSGWPPFVTDDEGTYMAEAWAVATGRGPHHGLAQYTYWYDHPPFGWIQLSWFARLFDMYRPGHEVVVGGRAVMLAYTLAGAALVFVLARQVGCTRSMSALALAMYGLSPLGVDYLRLVYLDGIGLPWVLGAFALALAPRQSVTMRALAGLCFGAGVLSKETYLLLLPALVFALSQRAERGNRRMHLTAFAAVFVAVGAYYPLYALLKGEFFPGPGHVSLLGGVEWQLSQRAGSGSIFSSSSVSHQLVETWVHSDPWLLGLGAACALPALLVPRLRPIAFGALTFIVTLLRNGYLPEPFVIGFLPFAALAIAGCLDVAGRGAWPLLARALGRARATTRPPLVVQFAALLALAGAAFLVLPRIAPRWATADAARMTTLSRALQPLAAAETYISRHVPRSATVLVDDVAWTDLVDDGWAPKRVVWAYKLDLDPTVVSRYPQGWRDMDYVLLTETLRADLVAGTSGLGSTVLAIRHSTTVAKFGSGPERVVLLRVERHAKDTSPAPARAGINPIPGAPKQ